MAICTRGIFAWGAKSTRDPGEIKDSNTWEDDANWKEGWKEEGCKWDENSHHREQDSSPSTSSFSLYDIDFEIENFVDASSQTPSLMKEASSPHKQGKEINSSQSIVKILS